MPHALRVHQAPRQGLHAAEAAAHYRRELADAEAVGHARLGVDPVFHRDHREARAVGLAGLRMRAHRAGRAEARAEVVDADDEEAVGVDRLARPDHVVPPADLALGMHARHVVRGVERVADEHGVGALGIERAVGLDHQVVADELRAVAQRQRLGEVHALGYHQPTESGGSVAAGCRGVSAAAAGSAEAAGSTWSSVMAPKKKPDRQR